MQKKKTVKSVKDKIFIAVSSFIAGLINAVFGTGAGMIYIIALSRLGVGRDSRIFATSSLAVLVLSAVSATAYAVRGQLPLTNALPMCIFGAIGGAIGALLLGKINPKLLRLLLAVLLIIGGVRMIRG